MIWTLPNILTLLRLLAAFGVAACFVTLSAPISHLAAFGLFALASVTDLVDGYVARYWNLQSRFGEMLDPIADKVLVLITLTVLIGASGTGGWLLIPAAVIIFREVLVSGIREYVAGKKLHLRVTKLAKWKTSVQMVAIGGLLLSQAISDSFGVWREFFQNVFLTLLWLAAGLTLISGYDYFRKSARHLIA